MCERVVCEVEVYFTKCPFAMPNGIGCHQVPRLLHKQSRKPRRQRGTNRATRASQCHKCHACDRSEGRCRRVAHLPHKVKFHFTKFQPCHAKLHWMSLSATPATQTAAATTASNRNQARDQSQPSVTSAGLPQKVQVNVAKCRTNSEGRCR